MELERRLGRDPEAWTWGEVRVLSLDHPLAALPGFERIFRRGPHPLPGEADTVWAASHPITDPVSGTKTSGPGVRFVANLADPDETLLVLCGGQSGHPASPQYDDQVADWLAGRARRRTGRPRRSSATAPPRSCWTPRSRAGSGARLALAAAVLHATWNLLIVRARDTQAATGVALIASVVLFLPVTVIVWDVERAAIPYIVVSGLLELAYIALLAAAYDRVPLSIVYPVARGTAPVLVLVIGALFLGIHPSAGQVAGILVVAAGVMIVRGLGRDVDPRQLILPLAVACTIASYTLVDRSGIHHAGAIPYFELTAIITLAYPVWIVRRRGVGVLRAELSIASVVAGGAMFAAYCLVLAALRLAPPGPVAAVRESSVVIATALAAVTLGEEVSRVRMLGAGLVAGGVAMLALT